MVLRGRQVLDAGGGVLPRAEASGVAVKLVTCGGQYMPPNATAYPPVAGSGCEEYLGWRPGPAAFTCAPAGCDQVEIRPGGVIGWT